MNKKYILPGALVLAGLILRFFFTGVAISPTRCFSRRRSSR